MISRKVTSFLPLGTQAVSSLFQRGLSSSNASAKAKDPEPVPISKLYDNFLDGTSSTYLEELERRYQTDPNSVDKTWASFFSMASASPALTRAPDQKFRSVTIHPRHLYDGCRQRYPARSDLGIVS